MLTMYWLMLRCAEMLDGCCGRARGVRVRVTYAHDKAFLLGHCRHRVDTVHYVPPPPPIITK
eukprot:scaffold16219_cov102-Isochrysis_galbana.AAC.21